MAISEWFIHYLQRREDITPNDLVRLRAISTTRITVLPGSVIVSRQVNPGSSAMLVRGMAARSHPALDRVGGRVISALYVAGDFVDLDGFAQGRFDHDIIANSCCEVELVRHDVLHAVIDIYPRLNRLILRLISFEAAIYRRWLVVAASLRSSAHLAHLVCELYIRLARIGAARNHHLTLPLLQRELAEVLGYSSIHVNRAVRDLRDRGLLQWRGSEIAILDWDGLVRLARFDADYLGPEGQALPWRSIECVTDIADTRCFVP